jgi:hypothetical protein
LLCSARMAVMTRAHWSVEVVRANSAITALTQ